MQEFWGPVSGGVASRDIIYQYGVVSQPEQPESKLQADFYKHTGIWCPKGAREALEHLMEHHGFTSRELLIAWRAGSLQWKEEESHLAVLTPLIEALFSWGMCLASALFYTGYGLSFAFRTQLHDWRPAAGLVVATAVFGGAMYMSGRFFLWPRRIAKRVIRSIRKDVNNPGKTKC